MTTVEVTLDDETFALLEEQARMSNVRVEDLLAAVAAAQAHATGDEAVRYHELARRHMARFPVAFQRLSE